MTKTFAVWSVVTLGFALRTSAAELRLGLVGTDTSHVIAFTRILNDASSPDHVPGARVVAAYKGGTPDFAPSRTRIEGFTRELRGKWGVEIVSTIPELCQRVDGVLLTSVDGRVHLAQAREIVAAHKPLFIDKPLASTLEDARAIARMAREAGVVWFSASSERFNGVARLRTPDLEGAETWGPGPFVEHHQLDLSWYGIHSIEMLFTLMGTGCEEVIRITSDDTDFVIGRWPAGRIGTVRILRPYARFGAVVFRKDSKNQTFEVGDLHDSYVPLVREIVKFFGNGVPPVPNDETLEIFSFLDAAQRSKAGGGTPIRLQ